MNARPRFTSVTHVCVAAVLCASCADDSGMNSSQSTTLENTPSSNSPSSTNTTSGAIPSSTGNTPTLTTTNGASSSQAQASASSLTTSNNSTSSASTAPTSEDTNESSTSAITDDVATSNESSTPTSDEPSSGEESGGSGDSASSASSDTGVELPEEATFLPDPQWACGMAEGIPSPKQGELAFTITLNISDEHEVGNTPYGYRRLLDVSGGTITGDRLQGSVMTGGLEYELTLENGVLEYQGINILTTDDGSRVFVRSCGVAPDENSPSRIIPDFEATTNGAYAFLNTGTWVATRELADGKLKLDVYDVSMVTAGEPSVEIKKPEGVPPQPWECNKTQGTKGAEVLTENVTLGTSFSIANAKYGSRNVIPITGGTTTGRVNGAILNGGADYQLSGSLDAWYTLAPDNGEFILVRNCGASGGLIPWFEAAVDGEFDFLNTQAYLSSAPGVGGGGVSITFYERN